ncbi:MAG: hypothetical protein LBT40_15730 [Deltaproteobacteria bacterium]|jgi:hypothetical protein|nr:hypothetical protein [Deltaproteobacteria bacterium]
MTPEMFYERFPEAKPEMMPAPAERREARRQCHLAVLAGRNPIPDCRAELIEKDGHIFGITAGQAGPGSGNGDDAADGAREAGADMGFLRTAMFQEAGRGDGRVPSSGLQALPSGYVADWTGAERAVTVMASEAQSGPSVGPAAGYVSGSETVGAVPMASGSQSGPSFGPSGTHGSGA